MRDIAIIFLLCVVGILLVFYSLHAAGVPDTLSMNVPAIVVGLIPFLHQMLERQKLRGTDEGEARVLSREGYGIAPLRIVIYAVLISYAAANLPGIIAMMFAALFSIEEGDLADAMGLFVIVLLPPMLFMVGRWMGHHARSHGLMCVLAVAFLTRLVGSLVDVSLIPDRDYALMFGEAKSIERLIVMQIGGTAFYFVFLAIGYWRGRRHRLAAYLRYLLRNVGEEVREAVVELAYEEALRHRRSRSTAPAPATGVAEA